MPSHQIRIRQNNCDHQWPYMDTRLIQDFPDLPDGRKCIKCGIDWDKVHGKKVTHISTPISTSYQWIKDRFIKD